MFSKLLAIMPTLLLGTGTGAGHHHMALLLNKSLQSSQFKSLRLFSVDYKKLNLKSESIPNGSERVVIQNKIKISDSLEINYGKIGQGSQVVLCIPGMLGTITSAFEPIMRKFDPSKFTVLSLDLPGYGQSQPPSRHFMKNFFQKDAEAVDLLMQTLEIPKYSIIGCGHGGTVGMHLLATSSAPAIDKLVFWGTRAFVDREATALTKKMLSPVNWTPANWQIMLDIYEKSELQRILKEFYYWSVKAANYGYGNVNEILPTINIPTLILHGDQDSSCPSEHAQNLHKGIANSILEVWPEGENNFHLQFQDRFVQRVEAFLLSAK